MQSTHSAVRHGRGAREDPQSSPCLDTTVGTQTPPRLNYNIKVIVVTTSVDVTWVLNDVL